MSFMKSKGISIKDGFPNAATDTSLKSLDLNQLLIQHPISTFFMSISDKKIAIIDRALKAQKNDLVIWWEGEEFVVSPLHQVPLDTPVWGVITSIIHQYRS